MDVTLGVRPEHITFAKDTGSHTITKVDVSEMMGSEVHLHVTAGEKDVVLRIPTTDLRRGAPRGARGRPQGALYLPAGAHPPVRSPDRAESSGSEGAPAPERRRPSRGEQSSRTGLRRFAAQLRFFARLRTKPPGTGAGCGSFP